MVFGTQMAGADTSAPGNLTTLSAGFCERQYPWNKRDQRKPIVLTNNRVVERLTCLHLEPARLTHLRIENDLHCCPVATGTKRFVELAQRKLMGDQRLGVHPPLGQKLDRPLPGCPHIPERTNHTQLFHGYFVKVRVNLTRIDSHWHECSAPADRFPT